MADDRTFLLPVVIDDTLEVMARVPDRFRERQWTRLPGGATPAAFADRVQQLLALGRAPSLPRWRRPIAQVHGARGEVDAAFEWLGRAYDQRDPGLIEMKAEPRLRSLHTDQRWNELLHKMRLG